MCEKVLFRVDRVQIIVFVKDKFGRTDQLQVVEGLVGKIANCAGRKVGFIDF